MGPQLEYRIPSYPPTKLTIAGGDKNTFAETMKQLPGSGEMLALKTLEPDSSPSCSGIPICESPRPTEGKLCPGIAVERPAPKASALPPRSLC